MSNTKLKEPRFQKVDLAFMERVSTALADTNMPQRDIADRLGTSTSKINKMMTKKQDFGVVVLFRFLRTFPEYSIIWIFTGEGKMRTKDKPEQLAENHERRILDLEDKVAKLSKKKK